MSEPIDAKLQLSPGNLVSPKHDDLLEVSTNDAVMEFPYHLPNTWATPTETITKRLPTG